MRLGISSLAISVVVLSIIFWLNVRLYLLNRGEGDSDLMNMGVGNIRLLLVGLALLALILGLLGLQRGQRFSGWGVILSGMNIILSFLPVWSWFI